jgi:hypothetical protein
MQKLDFNNIPIGTVFYNVGDANTYTVTVDKHLIAGTKYQVTQQYINDGYSYDAKLWAHDFERASDCGILLDNMKEVHEYRINEAEEKLKTTQLELEARIKYHQKKLKELDS